MSLQQSLPSDLPGFRPALFGYGRRQVRECLAELVTQLRSTLDANAVLHRRLAEAHREIDRLRAAGPDTAQYRRWGDRISNVLRLAEEQASALRAEAEQEAEDIRARALAESLQARRDLEAALQARREREERLVELLSPADIGQTPLPTG